MADKNAQSERLNKLFMKRVHALAVIYLTERSDLQVEEAMEGVGIDFIVRLVSNPKKGLRQFGVKIKGLWNAVPEEDISKAIRPSLREIRRSGRFPYPVCILALTLQEQGWCCWAVEPAIGPDGKPGLQAQEEASCQPLDKVALDEIVRQVDHWYDALYDTLLTNDVGDGKERRKQIKS